MRTWDLVWLGWFAAFVVLEIPAALGWTPWRTLSATAWTLEGWGSAFKIMFLAGLVVLTVHIAFRWP